MEMHIIVNSGGVLLWYCGDGGVVAAILYRGTAAFLGKTDDPFDHVNTLNPRQTSNVVVGRGGACLGVGGDGGC